MRKLLPKARFGCCGEGPSTSGVQSKLLIPQERLCSHCPQVHARRFHKGHSRIPKEGPRSQVVPDGDAASPSEPKSFPTPSSPWRDDTRIDSDDRIDKQEGSSGLLGDLLERRIELEEAHKRSMTVIVWFRVCMLCFTRFMRSECCI